MRKPIRFLPVLGLVVASTTLVGPPAFAVPITYTETDTATGSLNGVAFTDANIVLTMNNNTTNVTGGPTLFDNVGTVTVQVGAGAPVTFTDSMEVFSNQAVPAVGFEDATIPADVLDTASASFATYALTTSIGPITGTAEFNPGESFPTTGGDFILTSVGDPTFTATTSVVPAPLIGRGLPVTLVLGGVLFGVKLLERSRKRRSLGTRAIPALT